ncbi:MAG: PQQ-dependent dehydrogenase, methanol/ethanol family [Gammaproteobacteria bacterium]
MQISPCSLALTMCLGLTAGSPALAVSEADILQAAGNTSEWLTYGRTYDNQRYVPLTQITPDNVAGLRPIWTLSTGSLDGLEATPLLSDGVLYFSGDYAHVFAVDARSGILKWRYQPEYEEGLEAKLCCGPVNRGVALAGDLVYVTTLDARLVALNKTDGSVVWEKTIGDWQAGYTATAAPLLVKDKILVGIAGAEYGVRGYIKALDAKSGEEAWTTYTIPAPGEPGNDSWPGETWKTGGASTWVTGVYDPDLNLVYWGTGNPGPWNSDLRKGDNLWSSAIIAMNADSGKIEWGYQYTPNDAWDYDGNCAPILADISINGELRKVAVQANRNGFLYVLDRTNGEFIYAKPTVPGINWTTGLDPQTGRPAVNEDMRPLSGGKTVEPIIPGLEGGTNWFPIAYNPELNYVFLNSNDWAMAMTAWPGDKVTYNPGDIYMGVDFQMYRTKDHIGRVMAFDLNSGEFAWETPNPLPLFAGILATQSGLIFTGDQRGYAMALDARSGKELWRFQTGSGINASPISYELDGVQYVAILSGLGGDPSFYYAGPKGGMLWVFALEGAAPADSELTSQIDIPGALPRLESSPE